MMLLLVLWSGVEIPSKLYSGVVELLRNLLRRQKQLDFTSIIICTVNKLMVLADEEICQQQFTVRAMRYLLHEDMICFGIVIL